VITFNLIFTPGSVDRLLPFALSLLQAPQARIRVVSNGCPLDEVELMRAAAAIDERVSYYVLPQARPVEHGYALNHLLERFDEPHFAFVDTDVIAGGNFMEGLEPIPMGGAVFAAPALWLLGDETVLAPGVRFLGGRQRVLADGTPIGGTALAVYDRAAVEPLWRRAPRGFGAHYWRMLPEPVRAAFSERDWRFDQFDTCRVVNLLMLVDGHRLENRDIPELHHIGGFSLREQQGTASVFRDLVALVRSRHGWSLRHIAGSVAFRTYARVTRSGSSRALLQRRQMIHQYVDTAVDAIRDGREPPAPLRTSSPELNRRLAALRSALWEQYPPALAALRDAAS
jgi:hypothetical protein